MDKFNELNSNYKNKLGENATAFVLNGEDKLTIKGTQMKNWYLSIMGEINECLKYYPR